MNAEAALKTTLNSLGVPVARMIYNGNADTFITYQLVLSGEMAFADDDNEAEEYLFRVDIYSRRDYIALLRRAKQALKLAGFYGVAIQAELYENDTQLFHVPINVYFCEEVGAAT